MIYKVIIQWPFKCFRNLNTRKGLLKREEKNKLCMLKVITESKIHPKKYFEIVWDLTDIPPQVRVRVSACIQI